MTVLLRPLEERDCESLFRWINDRDLVALSAPFRSISMTEHRAWFEAIRVRPDVRIFAIARRAPDAAIGYCQLLNIDSANGNAELQIRIGDADGRDKGLGTLAVRRLLEFGFGELQLHRIQLHLLHDNVRAYRTYLKCGFREEGRLRQAVCIDGNYKDVIWMGILRGEFLPRGA